MSTKESTLAEQRRIAGAADTFLFHGGIERGASLDDFAREIHVSRRSVQRALIANGAPWSKRRFMAQMTLASIQLAQTDKSIKEIAHMLGFKNPAQFARRFRQTTNASPTEWRERHREDS